MKGKGIFRLSLMVAAIISSGSSKAQDSNLINSFNIWYDEAINEKGLAIGELNLKEASKEDLKILINEESILFKDDGRDGDKKAGDNIYSALLPFNINLILAEQIGKLKDPKDFEGNLDNLIKFPKFLGRAIAEDDEKLKELLVAKDDSSTFQRLEVLKKLQPELGKLDSKKLFEQLTFDPKETPLLSVSPREGRDSISKIIGLPFEVFANVDPASINPSQTLMITNPMVIEDPSRTFNVCKVGMHRGTPGGVWTFSYLMKKLSTGSGLTPEQYTLNWLNTWKTNQTLANGDVANKKINISKIIATWTNESPNKIINIDYFPATLMAIVNRPDNGLGLKGVKGGYLSTGEMKKGETRFTFALLERSSTIDPSPYLSKLSKINNGPVATSCQTIPFTVIFEYNNPVSSCSSIQAWQNTWSNLNQYSLGSSEYNSELANLTTPVVNNSSLLAHLRTNEKALGDSWELREFVRGSLGQLKLDPLDNTPKASYNNTSSIPACLSNTPSCEAAADTAPKNWNSPTFVGNPFARLNFALNTCSGCHTSASATNFTHIGWSSESNFPDSHEFSLSSFLTGQDFVQTLPDPFDSNARFNPFSTPILDPITNEAVSFNDLARRQVALASVLNASCGANISLMSATSLKSLTPINGTNFNSVH